jgi:hypothetical protein
LVRISFLDIEITVLILIILEDVWDESNFKYTFEAFLCDRLAKMLEKHMNGNDWN